MEVDMGADMVATAMSRRMPTHIPSTTSATASRMTTRWVLSGFNVFDIPKVLLFKIKNSKCFIDLSLAKQQMICLIHKQFANLFLLIVTTSIYSRVSTLAITSHVTDTGQKDLTTSSFLMVDFRLSTTIPTDILDLLPKSLTPELLTTLLQLLTTPLLLSITPLSPRTTASSIRFP